MTEKQNVDSQVAAKGYVHPEVLVTTQWVADHLNDPSIRIVETNEDILLYDQGHIPGAINLPLFTNEERTIVGTIYKREGREPAIKRGLELVGPKMRSLIEQVEAVPLSTSNR